jgi:hypothetical protein
MDEFPMGDRERASHEEAARRLRNQRTPYTQLRIRILTQEFITGIKAGRCDQQLDAILKAVAHREFEILNGTAEEE